MLKGTIVFLLCVILGGAMFIGFSMVPPSPDPIILPGLTTIDTLYLPQDTIQVPPIIIKVPIRDTIFIDSNQDSMETGIASLDTIIETGDTLSVDYYIVPSVFDLRVGYQMDSSIVLKETRIDTFIQVNYESKKYDNFLYGFISGNVSMLVLFKILIGTI